MAANRAAGIMAAPGAGAAWSALDHLADYLGGGELPGILEASCRKLNSIQTDATAMFDYYAMLASHVRQAANHTALREVQPAVMEVTAVATPALAPALQAANAATEGGSPLRTDGGGGPLTTDVAVQHRSSAFGTQAQTVQ